MRCSLKVGLSIDCSIFKLWRSGRPHALKLNPSSSNIPLSSKSSLPLEETFHQLSNNVTHKTPQDKKQRKILSLPTAPCLGVKGLILGSEKLLIRSQTMRARIGEEDGRDEGAGGLIHEIMRLLLNLQI